MADDAERKPAPRPRRRRTDIDPTLKTPRVANGRRRSDRIPDEVTPAPTDAAEAAAAAAIASSLANPASPVEPTAEGPDSDVSTTRFLIPGAAQATARLTTTPAAAPDHAAWLPMLDDRSPDPNVCPFLRAVGDGDGLVAPVETPDPANRCAALREAVPQSLRQQELVCLASGHVNCPRYLRGALVVAETPVPVVRAGPSVTPAVLGSLVLLVMAFSASVAFVLARGGMELTAAAPTASPEASATAVAVASVAPSTVPSPVESVAPTASPTPTPTASPSPTSRPTPAPTPSPTPEPTATPAPTSDRYALLRPCPNTPDCWIYRVRSGDNLYSIANYFGVSQDSIYDRNPFVRNGLRAGQDLRIPPPTR